MNGEPTEGRGGGDNPGTRRRWTADDEHRLATELAERADDLRTLSQRWGVSHGYMRRISSGDRRPRVKRMVDELVEQSVDAAARIARAQTRAAVGKLVAMMENAVDPATGRRRYSEVAELAATKELLRLGLVDNPEFNTSNVRVTGGAVLLTDVIAARHNMPPRLSVALGLTGRSNAELDDSPNPYGETVVDLSRVIRERASNDEAGGEDASSGIDYVD